MVSSGSTTMFSIVSLASLVLVSILNQSMMSKQFASVLLRFSYELPRSDSNGRRGVSALCPLAKPYKRAGCPLLTSSYNITGHLSRLFCSWLVNLC